MKPIRILTLLVVAGMSLYSQSQPPPPVRARADETLDVWNKIGNKLIAMARDFPADKYDFKLRKTNAPLRRIFYTSPQSTTT